MLAWSGGRLLQDNYLRRCFRWAENRPAPKHHLTMKRNLAVFFVLMAFLLTPAAAFAHLSPSLMQGTFLGVVMGAGVGLVVYVICLPTIWKSDMFCKPVRVLVCLAALPIALLLGIYGGAFLAYVIMMFLGIGF